MLEKASEKEQLERRRKTSKLVYPNREVRAVHQLEWLNVPPVTAAPAGIGTGLCIFCLPMIVD